MAKATKAAQAATQQPTSAPAATYGTGTPVTANVHVPVTNTGLAATMRQMLAQPAATPTARKPQLFTASLQGAAGGFACGAKYGGHVVTPTSTFAAGKAFNPGPQGSAKAQINAMLLAAVAAGHTYAQWVQAVQAANLWAPVQRPQGGTTYPAWHLLRTALANGWLVLA